MFDRVFRAVTAGAAATLMLATLTSNALAAPGGTVRYVDDDGLAGTNDCNGALAVPTSIQDAVDAANPGDNIRVCPGTYYGPLDMAKAGLTVSAVTPWTALLRVDTTTMTDNADLVYMHDAAEMKLRWMTLVIPTQAPCPTGITGVATDNATHVQIRANHIQFEGPVDGDCGIAAGIRLARSPRGRAVYNRISDFRSNGIFALYSPNSRIAGNTINFSHASTPDQRAALASAVVVFGSSQAQVTHNFVRGYATSIDNEQLVYGVRVVTIDGAELGPTVSNNHFNDVQTAIGLGVNAAVSTTQATVIFNSGTVGIRYGIVLSLADHGDIGRNTFSASVLGIGVSDTSTANNIHDNDFVGASNPDCEDDSTGSGTSNTANTWLDDLGDTSSPAGICDTAS